MGCRLRGFGVGGLGFEVWGPGFGVQDLGFRVSGFQVSGVGFPDFGIRVSRLGVGSLTAPRCRNSAACSGSPPGEGSRVEGLGLKGLGLGFELWVFGSGLQA